MNNDSIKQGAYYLLRGGTLLAEPCKKCGNLQIKYKGEILCMSCQTNNLNKDTSSRSDTKKSSTSITNLDDPEKIALIDKNSNSKIDKNLVLDETEDKLIRIISDLGVNLVTQESSKELRNSLKCIRKSLEVLELIRRMKRQ